MARIEPGSHVTMHYRLTVPEGGGEWSLMDTFDLRPATVQLGAGQLAPALETRLIGLEEGATACFDLAAGEAYGARQPELVQTVARTTFDANTDADARYLPGDVVEFRAAAGPVCGVLKSCDDAQVVIDFNHPLAGVPLRFAVRVIGVL